MARLIACSSCGRVHAKDYICKVKKQRQRQYRKDKIDTAIYRANKWHKIRGQVLEDYNYVCLYTFYKEGKIIEANQVHHIIELLDDESLAYDEDNLIPMSKEKHRLIHELYKDNKRQIQEELREMKKRWNNGERAIGLPPS